jgi:CRISPR system Cascade subunit CasE
VLGYAPKDWDALHTRAKLSASPAAYETCLPDRCAAKPMPETVPEGMDLRFDLRACPVVRKASAGEGVNQNGETRTWEAGDELDAFLAEAWTRPADEDLSREPVYRDWLARQFDIRGGAEPQSIGMTRFSIERMTRRNGPDRTADTLKRPDVTLTGTLTVTDGDAFTDLLRSGLGRHKSFGYGMLKVRRV